MKTKRKVSNTDKIIIGILCIMFASLVILGAVIYAIWHDEPILEENVTAFDEGIKAISSACYKYISSGRIKDQINELSNTVPVRMIKEKNTKDGIYFYCEVGNENTDAWFFKRNIVTISLEGDDYSPAITYRVPRSLEDVEDYLRGATIITLGSGLMFVVTCSLIAELVWLVGRKADSKKQNKNLNA